jgi:hypothetical protein
MSTSTTSVHLPFARKAGRPTVADLGPVLVSELPPVGAQAPGLMARVKDELAARRSMRSFERAVRNAGHSEQHDLLALGRRD